MKNLLISLRLLLVMTVVTGLLYPLSLLAVARLFPAQAEGSLVLRGGVPVGSSLLAQRNDAPGYFLPRPSAGDFATVASAASNLGPTSAVLAKAVAERRAAWGEGAPADLLTTSGSGLDPHLSPEAARFQAARVAEVRKIPESKVIDLIKNFTDGPQFGFLGEPRVRILELNLALDEFGKP